MKCEKCGKKIEYNNYKLICGGEYENKILCSACAKAIIDERLKAIKEKRATRKAKRGKRKKSKKSAESYNPFVGDEK